MAQLASALAWGARGRPFKSDHPDKKRAKMSSFLFMVMRCFQFFQEEIKKVLQCLVPRFTLKEKKYKPGKIPFNFIW